MKAFVGEVLGIIALAVVIFFLQQAAVQSYVIEQHCMEPGFEEGERVLANKVVYMFHEPEMGDIIILQPPPPLNPAKGPFIKRIIALPGQTVEVKDGEVYVDGNKLHEPYIKEPPTYTLQREIPPNMYFVLGDNRNIADDSHNEWLLPRKNIIGKAWFSFWPPDEWGLAPNYNLEEQLAGS